LPASFIKYYADKITGKDINPSLVDNVTLGCLIFAVVASVYVNFLLKKKKAGLVILSAFLATTLTAQQPDTAIVWSETKVMWSDFKEKNSYDKYPYKLAKTSWKLKVDITDTCHCDNPVVSVNAAALFFPYSSLVRGSATNNSTLLAHERLHFDIVELFARQLRKQLSETQFTLKNYKREVDKIKRKTFLKLHQWQNNYDKETSGGNDIEKQAQWQVSILKEIAELENYIAITVVLLFKL
jgi:Bacterial protein of unknown function (DUF922)